MCHSAYGEGVKALRAFGRGELVFRFDGTLLSHQTLFTLQKRKHLYIEDPYVMGKVLHACDPNMAVDMERQTFHATRDIRTGEFLTMDYETTEDVLFNRFHCRCGSGICRGLIAGRLVR